MGKIERDVPGWVPIGPIRKEHGKKHVRLARCGCGREQDVGCNAAGELRSKTCQACLSLRMVRHGQSIRGRVSSLYRTWQAMMDRCHNEKCSAYLNYGGRGIFVYVAWRESFETFERDVGARPEKAELDRIDNERGYEPGNVRWATRVENQNNKRTNRLLTHAGETMTLAQWARRIGCRPGALLLRIDRSGMTIEKALTIPFGDMAETRRQNNSFTSITYVGETLTCNQWAKRTGISPATIRARHLAGWTPECVLTTPGRVAVH